MKAADPYLLPLCRDGQGASRAETPKYCWQMDPTTVNELTGNRIYSFCSRRMNTESKPIAAEYAFAGALPRRPCFTISLHTTGQPCLCRTYQFNSTLTPPLHLVPECGLLFYDWSLLKGPPTPYGKSGPADIVPWYQTHTVTKLDGNQRLSCCIQKQSRYDQLPPLDIECSNRMH